MIQSAGSKSDTTDEGYKKKKKKKKKEDCQEQEKLGLREMLQGRINEQSGRARERKSQVIREKNK